MKKALYNIHFEGKVAWKTSTILAELASKGYDPGWFADCVGAMVRGQDQRMRMRALELIQRFVIHQEGSKLQISSLEEKTTDEIQEAYEQIRRELTQEAAEGAN
jgi:hypothetical protein